jgi:hypothetical protein
MATRSRPDVNDLRPVVAATEAVKDALVLPPPKPVVALPAPAGGITAGEPPRKAEIAASGTLSASGETRSDRPSANASLPLVMQEIRPASNRSASVAVAPVAEEPDPAAAAPIFQSSLPPIPKPAPPQAVPSGDQVSAPDIASRGASEPPAAKETPPPRAPVAAEKRDARTAANARTQRALARSRAAKLRAKSRYSARYNRKKRRAVVQYRQEPAPAPAPLATAAPARPQAVAPFKPLATKMFEGWAREWSTQTVPLLTRPRPAQ